MEQRRGIGLAGDKESFSIDLAYGSISSS